MIEKTFGMIKPEGLRYADDIEKRILSAGLKIEEKKETVLTENQFEKLYGYTKNKIPDIYEAMKNYLTSNAANLLLITGENAKYKLLKLRGSSNASEAERGTIRGDYAREQDYETLYAQKKFAKNVFHSAEPSEADEMVDFFFRGKK